MEKILFYTFAFILLLTKTSFPCAQPTTNDANIEKKSIIKYIQPPHNETSPLVSDWNKNIVLIKQQIDRALSSTEDNNNDNPTKKMYHSISRYDPRALTCDTSSNVLSDEEAAEQLQKNTLDASASFFLQRYFSSPGHTLVHKQIDDFINFILFDNSDFKGPRHSSFYYPENFLKNTKRDLSYLYLDLNIPTYEDPYDHDKAMIKMNNLIDDKQKQLVGINCVMSDSHLLYENECKSLSVEIQCTYSYTFGLLEKRLFDFKKRNFSDYKLLDSKTLIPLANATPIASFTTINCYSTPGNRCNFVIYFTCKNGTQITRFGYNCFWGDVETIRLADGVFSSFYAIATKNPISEESILDKVISPKAVDFDLSCPDAFPYSYVTLIYDHSIEEWSYYNPKCCLSQSLVDVLTQYK